MPGRTWESVTVTSPIEPVIGYQFSDRSLLAAASSTTSRAFGPLEHLGDAIADLAVAVTCWRDGMGSAEAASLVANDHLDLRFQQLLSGLVEAVSGDAIEALVGAVFLDGGFDAAARVAVRVCIPGVEWTPLGTRAVASRPAPKWIGPIAIDAAVTDHAVRSMGVNRTSQRRLNDTRVQVVSHAAMKSAVSKWLKAEGIEVEHPTGWFQRQVATKLIEHGWSQAAAFVVSVLLK